MVNVRNSKYLPKNPFGWTSLLIGLFSVTLYTTQLFWGWFGTDATDQMIFSLIVLVPMCIAISCAFEDRKQKRQDWSSVLKNSFKIFIAVFTVVLVLNGIGMGMDTTYATQADDSGLGLFYGIRMLSNVSDADINNLANWGIGLKTIIKALFLIVPFLVATWGALSVLTADSFQEASTGIFALLAAIIFSIIVWVFRLVDVILY